MKFIKKAMAFLIIGIFICISAFSHFAACASNDIIDYEEYISNAENTASETGVLINASDYVEIEGRAELKSNEYGFDGTTLYTSESSSVTWEFDVPQSGLYNIIVNYFTVEGKGNKICRKVLIDGIVPFKEASSVNFKRIFENQEAIKQDEMGNDLLPMQQEKNCWCVTALRDNTKRTSDKLAFDLEKGKHTLTFKAVYEPLVISTIEFVPAEFIPSYSEYISASCENQAQNVNIKIEGEAAQLKSDSSIIPVADQGKYFTYPADPTRIRLNTIGGTNWSIAGQWVQWNFTVPSDGLYKITFRAKQSLNVGATSTRELYIDDEIPFKECSYLKFKYSTDWQDVTVAKADGEDALFYFTAGEHTLKLEANLGELSEIIDKAQQTLLSLNSVYRKILMLTGSSPDIYRDYGFEKQVPEIFPTLKEELENLNKIIDDLKSDSGQENENIAILITLREVVEKFIKDPEKIAKNFGSFSSNLTAMGTVLSNLKNRPLAIDRIFITSSDVEINKIKGNFFKSLIYDVRKFLLSFVANYNSVSSTSGEGKTVTVWLGNGTTAGRDQANVLKQLCQNYFTPQTGINVNLQLVSPGALLPSVITGKSPDVALSQGAGDPVNYACRNAAFDISKFPDFDNVIKRFHPSAMTPFKYNGGCFALPETQNFPVMFYRKDILEELNLTVPETWVDVINMIPELQKHQMNFGLPQAISQDGNAGVALSAFMTFLYQSGGELYRDFGKSSALDDVKTIHTFSEWTQYYTQYELPLQYDFSNRFRTGDVPIGIADYGTYNTLSIFAPELDGLWGISIVPGTKKSDGTINHTVAGSVSGSMIMKNAKDYDSAWQFVCWWTSADTQYRFGNAVEDILGSAARYATANIEAAKKIPWRDEESKILEKQWEYVEGIPEVPGGYVTGRFFDFAFRNVVNASKEAGTEIITAAANINSELTIKRKEFGIE